jgi:hypothetical protein
VGAVKGLRAKLALETGMFLNPVGKADLPPTFNRTATDSARLISVQPPGISPHVLHLLKALTGLSEKKRLAVTSRELYLSGRQKLRIRQHSDARSWR